MMMMIFTVSYCIFGMTLISMCLALMQEQIIEKVNWVMSSLGVNNNDEEVVKLSKDGRVAETPADKTGNDLTFNDKKERRKRADAEADSLEASPDEAPMVGVDNIAYEE